MGRVTKDRPLTDAQERFLCALADADLVAHAGGWMAVSERQWHEVHYLPVRDDDRPREVLEQLGLIELRVVNKPLSFAKKHRDVTEAKITEAGVAMLRSMGD